jgi:MarR family transcriptional regulator for hemolysin
MEQLNGIIFYSLDKAIRTYRQYAQQQLKKAGYTITIDQWLIIKTIMECPGITQKEIAEKVFKDNASVTRIIALLVNAHCLKREVSGDDRRRTSLKVTKDGAKIISDVHKVVLKNRATALKGISQENLKHSKVLLNTIINNCSK